MRWVEDELREEDVVAAFVNLIIEVLSNNSRQMEVGGLTRNRHMVLVVPGVCWWCC